MTDEERREAERLAAINWQDRDGYTGFLDGYAAACERKSAEIAALRELLVEWDDDLGEAVKAERVRAQKLIEIMQAVDVSDYDERMKLENAIAEYEAERDG